MILLQAQIWTRKTNKLVTLPKWSGILRLQLDVLRQKSRGEDGIMLILSADMRHQEIGEEGTLSMCILYYES